jgi:hypothetical protein
VSSRLLAVALLVALVALWLARPAQVTAPATGGGAGSPAPPSSPPTAASSPPQRLARDPFRYANEARVPATSSQSEPAPTPSYDAPAPAPSPEPIRLSGFVRQGGALKAVLSLYGTTVVAGIGETAEGFRVVSVDEDQGVRLRGPTGEELQLKPQAR